MLKHGGQYPEGVMDFSVNINPVIDEDVIGALLNTYKDKALCYPEIDAKTLELKIEKAFDIRKGCVYVGNGASDCLYQVARSLKSKSVLIIEPTFTEYKRAFEQTGASVLSLPFDLTKDQGQVEAMLLDQFKKIKADMVVLCNPNNPTGHCYSPSFVAKVAAVQNVHKGYVLVDESFRFFEDVDSTYNKDLWNLIVLTSLTKYYGIPGLRIGYLTSNISLIETMKSYQIPWTVNGLAIHATMALMDDEALNVRAKTWYKEEKESVLSALEAISYIKPNNSCGNFFLCKLEGVTGTTLNDWLMSRDIPLAIRTCTDFPGLGDAYMRIGLRSKEDNALLMSSLKDYEEVIG